MLLPYDLDFLLGLAITIGMSCLPLLGAVGLGPGWQYPCQLWDLLLGSCLPFPWGAALLLLLS